jgi:hypothetical protein
MVEESTNKKMPHTFYSKKSSRRMMGNFQAELFGGPSARSFSNG